MFWEKEGILALLLHDRNVGAFYHENILITSGKISCKYIPKAYVSEQAVVYDENIRNLQH